MKIANDENLLDSEKEYNELWDAIVNNGIATNAELELISYINGWRIETLKDVLYVRTGYRDLKEIELNED